jgi:predicted Zn-dependent protease
MRNCCANLFPMRRGRRVEWFARRSLAVGFLAFAIGVVTIEEKANSVGQQDIAGRLAAAEALHARADYAHSIPILEGIVRQDPQNYRANLLLGEDLLLSGKPRDAVTPLHTASEARADDIVALDYLLVAAAHIGDAATEAEAHESAVARTDGDERHLLEWGIFCLNRFHSLREGFLESKEGQGAELRLAAWGSPGGTEANLSMLETSAADGPEQPGIWGELGIAQFESGKQTQARSSLKEAQTREPQEAATLRLEALLAADDHDWQQAEDRLAELGSRSPAELANAIRLWPRYIMPQPFVSGAIWDCVRNLTAPCSITSGPAKGGEGLGARELFTAGRWEQLKAVPIGVKADAVEWFWHGVADFRTGDCPQAIPALERGLKANQFEAGFYLEACYAKEEARIEAQLSGAQHAGALHELKGERAFSLQDNPAAAQKEYVEAALSRPKDAYLLSRLAMTCATLGDIEQARTNALSALAADPRQTSALETLAQLDMNEGKYKDALFRLKRLSVLLPRDPRIQIDLGIAYGQLGDPAHAALYLEAPLKEGFPDPRGTLHALFATALRKVGRIEEAKQAAAEAIRLSNEEAGSEEHQKNRN